MKLKRSALAPAPKLAPRSAQASPNWFSSRPWAYGPWPLGSPRTPLAICEAITEAKPAWFTGSRRLPASRSICTSTMGMAWLCTRYTRAPLACVQCCIGKAACTTPAVSKMATTPACRSVWPMARAENWIVGMAGKTFIVRLFNDARRRLVCVWLVRTRAVDARSRP